MPRYSELSISKYLIFSIAVCSALLLFAPVNAAGSERSTVQDVLGLNSRAVETFPDLGRRTEANGANRLRRRVPGGPKSKGKKGQSSTRKGEERQDHGTSMPPKEDKGEPRTTSKDRRRERRKQAAAQKFYEGTNEERRAKVRDAWSENKEKIPPELREKVEAAHQRNHVRVQKELRNVDRAKERTRRDQEMKEAEERIKQIKISDDKHVAEKMDSYSERLWSSGGDKRFPKEVNARVKNYGSGFYALNEQARNQLRPKYHKQVSSDEAHSSLEDPWDVDGK